MEIGHRSTVGDFGEVSATNVKIGNYTNIAPFVAMHSRTQHGCVTHPELVSSSCGAIPGYPAATSQDSITIGSDVWIGRNAVLLGGITIGHGAIVGAYAVVAKDVQPYAVVVGNPAVAIRTRFDRTTVQRLLALRWWDWGDEVIAERAEELRDVYALLAAWD